VIDLAAGTSRPQVIATDLDGTLLDFRTYEFEPARPALAALSAAGVKLVLASSKTRAEMTELAVRIGDVAALVAENGGEVLVARGGAWRSIALGAPRAVLVAALAEMSRETGIVTRGFSEAAPEEIVRWTGLDGAAARRAMERSYDEPFVISAPAPGVASAALASAAARRGLVVSRGGRFHHLQGPVDKGRAFARVLAELFPGDERPLTAGLGDAANDLSLLLAVHRPVIVPRPDGGCDPVLVAALPDAERAPSPGPVGWNRAVLGLLGDRSGSPDAGIGE
jgi:mannosyl-3-phosphoglycerate phosphatase